MYGETKYEMTEFQRELYRFHMDAERRARTSHDTVTTIGIDADDPSKRTEHVAVLDRTLPRDLSGITRILRVDDIRNDGEGVTLGDRHYPERQILRVFAELEDEGRGVMAVTIDRLYGTLAWDFQYARWGGARLGGGGGRPIAELIQPGSAPETLALYRLCELLDADEEKGGYGLYRAFIAEALARPDGFGFPKFTADLGAYLVQRHNGGASVRARGHAQGVKRGAWYAHGWRDKNRPLDDALYFWIGKAGVASWQQDRPFWLDHCVKVTCENGGRGRKTPEYQYYIGDIWLAEGDTLTELDGSMAQAILRHVVRPPSDTGAIMSALLKMA